MAQWLTATPVPPQESSETTTALVNISATAQEVQLLVDGRWLQWVRPARQQQLQPQLRQHQPNTDPNGYLDCDSHIDADADPNRHGHRDSNIYGYSYSYVYCHCVRDRDGYCHGHCYTYCDADNYAPIHSYAETQPVATASSHSSAQAIGCLAWGFDLILAKPPATLGIRYHDQKNIDRVHPPIASAARKQLRHFGDAIENGARPDRHFAKDDRRNRNGHDGSQYQSVEWNWLRVAQCRSFAIRGRGESILQHSRIQRPFARSRSRLHSAPAATAVCASF